MAKKPTKAELKATELKQQRRTYKAGNKVDNVRERRAEKVAAAAKPKGKKDGD